MIPGHRFNVSPLPDRPGEPWYVVDHRVPAAYGPFIDHEVAQGLADELNALDLKREDELSARARHVVDTHRPPTP